MRYLGSKILLLDNIKQMIDRHMEGDEKTFCDLFSGTASVAKFFKQWYEVSSADLLYFSYVLQKAYIENDNIPSFQGLISSMGIFDPIHYLNNTNKAQLQSLAKEKRFFYNTYSPQGGRMYLKEENALRFDYMRNKIEEWHIDGLITDFEYYYLVACAIEGIPYISNISGTYGAFHKKWDKRVVKTYEMKKMSVISNGKKNKCFHGDGVKLLEHISGDILYLDPPYNHRQYNQNYHLLETAALYDFPEVKGITGQRAVRDGNSDFCSKRKALQSFEEVMKNANYRHVILSYSTEGLMAVDEIENIMKKYGKEETFDKMEIPYTRYKSKEQEQKFPLKELIFYIKKE